MWNFTKRFVGFWVWEWQTAAGIVKVKSILVNAKNLVLSAMNTLTHFWEFFIETQSETPFLIHQHAEEIKKSFHLNLSRKHCRLRVSIRFDVNQWKKAGVEKVLGWKTSSALSHLDKSFINLKLFPKQALNRMTDIHAPTPPNESI